MSDSGQEELKSRRRRKERDESHSKHVRSRRRSYSDDSEDAYPRRKDRSPYRKPDRYRDRDDDFEDTQSRNDRRDRRDDDSTRRYAEDSKRERDYRPRSRSREHSRHHRRSRSPPAKRRRHSGSISRSPPAPSKTVEGRSRAPLPSQADSFRGNSDFISTQDGAAPVEKQKPNYKPTGLLAKEANTVAGTTTVLKYHEPPEARKPPSSQQWRIYVFKKNDLLDTIHLHTRSVWLFGRDEKVTDYLIEHPSASKQHAVIQFRYISKTDEFGTKTGRVKPYLIDLDSANGTKLNGKKIAASRYVELIDKDAVAFGDSEREYVVMLPEAEKS